MLVSGSQGFTSLRLGDTSKTGDLPHVKKATVVDGFTKMPIELAAHICSFAHFTGVVALGQSCRFFYAQIYGNSLFFQKIRHSFISQITGKLFQGSLKCVREEVRCEKFMLLGRMATDSEKGRIRIREIYLSKTLTLAQTLPERDIRTPEAIIMKTHVFKTADPIGSVYFPNDNEVITVNEKVCEKPVTSWEKDSSHKNSSAEFLSLRKMEERDKAISFLIPTKPDLGLSTGLSNAKVLAYDHFIIAAACDTGVQDKFRLIVWDRAVPSKPMVNQTIESTRIHGNRNKCYLMSNICFLKAWQGLLWIGMMGTTQEETNPTQGVGGELWRFKLSDLYAGKKELPMRSNDHINCLGASPQYVVGADLINGQLLVTYVKEKQTMINYYDFLTA